MQPPMENKGKKLLYSLAVLHSNDCLHSNTCRRNKARPVEYSAATLIRMLAASRRHQLSANVKRKLCAFDLSRNNGFLFTIK